MMTEVYGTTSRMITEVGGGASRVMKVCGANESTLLIVSGNLIVSLVIDMRQYISRQKLLHKMIQVYRDISHKVDKLIVIKH